MFFIWKLSTVPMYIGLQERPHADPLLLSEERSAHLIDGCSGLSGKQQVGEPLATRLN